MSGLSALKMMDGSDTGSNGQDDVTSTTTVVLLMMTSMSTLVSQVVMLRPISTLHLLMMDAPAVVSLVFAVTITWVVLTTVVILTITMSVVIWMLMWTMSGLMRLVVTAFLMTVQDSYSRCGVRDD